MSNHQSYTVTPHDALKLKNLICHENKLKKAFENCHIHKLFSKVYQSQYMLVDKFK